MREQYCWLVGWQAKRTHSPAAIFSTNCNFSFDFGLLHYAFQFAGMAIVFVASSSAIIAKRKKMRCLHETTQKGMGCLWMLDFVQILLRILLWGGLNVDLAELDGKGPSRRKKRDSDQVFHKHVHLWHWYTPRLVQSNSKAWVRRRCRNPELKDAKRNLYWQQTKVPK